MAQTPLVVRRLGHDAKLGDIVQQDLARKQLNQKLHQTPPVRKNK